VPGWTKSPKSAGSRDDSGGNRGWRVPSVLVSGVPAAIRPTPWPIATNRPAEKCGLKVLSTGDCFGETSYVQGARRTATVRAVGAVTVLKVSSTLLEQVSASCQLRFNRVFLRSLINRLQNAEQRAVAS
jgi:CRP-like cAMP-binding protein